MLRISPSLECAVNDLFAYKEAMPCAGLVQQPDRSPLRATYLYMLGAVEIIHGTAVADIERLSDTTPTQTGFVMLILPVPLFTVKRRENSRESLLINALRGILDPLDQRFWTLITDFGNPEKVIKYNQNG
ncbi:MAG: hypothetical protein ACJA1T_001193 [Zhongshania aliphaticivorans]